MPEREEYFFANLFSAVGSASCSSKCWWNNLAPHLHNYKLFYFSQIDFLFKAKTQIRFHSTRAINIFKLFCLHSTHDMLRRQLRASLTHYESWRFCASRRFFGEAQIDWLAALKAEKLIAVEEEARFVDVHAQDEMFFSCYVCTMKVDVDWVSLLEKSQLHYVAISIAIDKSVTKSSFVCKFEASKVFEGEENWRFQRARLDILGFTTCRRGRKQNENILLVNICWRRRDEAFDIRATSGFSSEPKEF